MSLPELTGDLEYEDPAAMAAAGIDRIANRVAMSTPRTAANPAAAGAAAGNPALPSLAPVGGNQALPVPVTTAVGGHQAPQNPGTEPAGVSQAALTGQGTTNSATTGGNQILPSQDTATAIPNQTHFRLMDLPQQDRDAIFRAVLDGDNAILQHRVTTNCHGRYVVHGLHHTTGSNLVATSAGIAGQFLAESRRTQEVALLGATVTNGTEHPTLAYNTACTNLTIRFILPIGMIAPGIGPVRVASSCITILNEFDHARNIKLRIQTYPGAATRPSAIT